MRSLAAAGSVDTDLSFFSLLELYGTEIAQRRMPARRVLCRRPSKTRDEIALGLAAQAYKSAKLSLVNFSNQPDAVTDGNRLETRI